MQTSGQILDYRMTALTNIYFENMENKLRFSERSQQSFLGELGRRNGIFRRRKLRTGDICGSYWILSSSAESAQPGSIVCG